MPKRISFRQGLSSILFWSIISAAFIGPGTVTIAARAGADFRLQLLWALVFSILATISLQEAAARITIASGKSLGEIIALQFSSRKGKGLRWFLFIAVAFGCAAYQAGNLLGALSGLRLVSTVSNGIGALVLGSICFGFLWMGNFRRIARLLGTVVALMGIVFITVGSQSEVSFTELFQGTFQPTLPLGSAIIIVGLIGTTIVPYNLFLASGISQGQDVREMRIGLVPAILIGGIISVAIMVVGATITGSFSFESLSQALEVKLGNLTGTFFGFGLFAAGLSSSITAPLAAAITGRSLLDGHRGFWEVNGRYYRLVWMGVLGIGLFFVIVDIQPIPAIILAQAINGLLLPIVAIFLFVAVNNKVLLGEYANGALANFFMLIIVVVTCFLGLNNIWKAVNRAMGWSMEQERYSLFIFAGISVLIAITMVWRVLLNRR